LGPETIVHNFADVADRLNRDPLSHLEVFGKGDGDGRFFEGGKGISRASFPGIPSTG